MYCQLCGLLPQIHKAGNFCKLSVLMVIVVCMELWTFICEVSKLFVKSVNSWTCILVCFGFTVVLQWENHNIPKMCSDGVCYVIVYLFTVCVCMTYTVSTKADDGGTASSSKRQTRGMVNTLSCTLWGEISMACVEMLLGSFNGDNPG